jgi:hypothetical protein
MKQWSIQTLNYRLYFVRIVEIVNELGRVFVGDLFLRAFICFSPSFSLFIICLFIEGTKLISGSHVGISAISSFVDFRYDAKGDFR